MYAYSMNLVYGVSRLLVCRKFLRKYEAVLFGKHKGNSTSGIEFRYLPDVPRPWKSCGRFIFRGQVSIPCVYIVEI